MTTPGKRILNIVVAVCLVVGGYAVYRHVFVKAGLPEGLLVANGRLEGDHTYVSSKYPGRIGALLVGEGDSVLADQPLVKLEDAQTLEKMRQAKATVEQTQASVGEIEAELVQATSRIRQAESQIQEAKLGIQVLEKRRQAARMDLDAAEQELPLSLARAEAQIDQAESRVKKLDAAERQARVDAERFAELARRGTVERRRQEEADLAWRVAQDDLAAAKASQIQAVKQLASAELGKQKLQARGSEVAALEAQISQARAKLDQAHGAHAEALAYRSMRQATLRRTEAKQREAEAVLAEAQGVLNDLNLLSPRDGVVVAKMAEVGEMVSPGAPLLDLVNVDELYLKVYVPENQVGKIKLGIPAQVHIDAFPDEPFPATVRHIASQAEFTPKEVQTSEERVKQVYAVKLYLDANPEHRLTPGMPADAVIRWKEDVPWQPPVW